MHEQTTALAIPEDHVRPAYQGGGQVFIEKISFACPMLLSACLLFLVQPTIAKAILPWFGGSAGVWTACMLFFQVLLLAGYIYAHCVATYLSPVQQRLIHVPILVASVASLHFGMDPTWKPTANSEPIVAIVIVLTLSVGFPYFVLCTTSPLLQHWIGQSSSGKLPYRFYALSNFGSLLALGLYPLLIEPSLDTTKQLSIWSAVYVIFVALGVFVSIRSYRAEPRILGKERNDQPLSLSDACLLVATSASSAALLLSVSSSLSQDIAPIPFLWVLPLAIYLLTFILCFDDSKWYNVNVHQVALPIALVALTFVHSKPALPVSVVVGVHCLALLVACMFCHGLLARKQPGAQRVTAFYLWVALGGALGSFFVAVMAPLLFDQLLEIKIAIAGCLVIALHHLFGYSSRSFLAVCASAVVLVPLALDRITSSGETLAKARNFYGVLSVSESRSAGSTLRTMYHGRILHGTEYIEHAQTLGPTTYYGQESGAGLALERNTGPQRVGLVGLGAGTLAWYGKSGDYYRFYEINPLVEALARKHFGYLRNSAAQVDVVIGDGRTALEREPNQGFDTLILDAFSGDSVPVHLLTVEALASYLRHLKSDGVLAIHISNDYLDLAPVVQAAARANGKDSWLVHSAANTVRRWSESNWVIVSSGNPFTTEISTAGYAKPLENNAKLPAWTDTYSNLLMALK